MVGREAGIVCQPEENLRAAPNNRGRTQSSCEFALHALPDPKTKAMMIFDHADFTATSPEQAYFDLDIDQTEIHGHSHSSVNCNSTEYVSSADVLEMISASTSFVDASPLVEVEPRLLLSDVEEQSYTNNDMKDLRQDSFDFALPQEIDPEVDHLITDLAAFENNGVGDDENRSPNINCAQTAEPHGPMPQFSSSFNNSSSSSSVRPQPRRQKSNPFYFPSKHIKNMISKETKRQSCRKTQNLANQSSWESLGSLEDQSCSSSQNSKPLLERRQTVL
ncbi:LAME_0A02894g1_1 [Lachancea meyersii CBS 8951]|uniref:LAME_0A02894g1_1 n=1 Tax=Lachancea meyersii CBS 8951 TaxID=1266667 RepID=A0A1G4IMT3_9SACH|nr:LAME_0A02894g1_1 [Lachancea meyersii CBS 8951]